MKEIVEEAFDKENAPSALIIYVGQKPEWVTKPSSIISIWIKIEEKSSWDVPRLKGLRENGRAAISPWGS